MNVSNRIAIITGASKGLGAAIAKLLVERGTMVYGLARNKNDLNQVQIRLGENFIPVIIDVSNQKAISSFIVKTFSEKHTPEILINNAGAGHFGNIDELSLEQWHAMINTNINGLFYVTSQVVPFMKRNENSCHIINIGSILGKVGRAGGSAYCLTKYGVQGFSEALFKELRSYNIKVSCVNPGSIATHFFEDSAIKPHDNMIQPNELANVILHILETPDNLLIDEITIRPLNPEPTD